MLTTGVAAGVGAAPAQAAAAGTVDVVSARLNVKPAGGTTNRIVISGSAGTFTVDDRVALKAGRGCKAVKGDKTRVTCTGVNRGLVHLGKGNDVFVNDSALRVFAYGDSGQDTLVGGPGGDFLHGGSGDDTVNGVAGDDQVMGGTGNDRIYGGAGDDYLYDRAGSDRTYGGAGNDVFYDGAGTDRYYGNSGDDEFYNSTDFVSADRFYGGPGIDTVSWEAQNKAVKADADQVYGDDGRSGEHDSVASDVENLSGSNGNDTLIGTAGSNVLTGGYGSDRLYGLGGDDVLLSDYKSAGSRDDNVDHLDGGTHVTGDTCAANAGDTTINCEINA